MSKGASTNALALLQKSIRELMNQRADDIAMGSCQSYEDYKHSTGVIEGLALAERELLDLDSRIEEA